MGQHCEVPDRTPQSVIWLSAQTAYKERISQQALDICSQIFEKLEPLCKKTDCILEIGAGPGVMLDVFRYNGYTELAATEITKDAVDALSASGCNAIRNDMHQLFLVDHTYGVYPKLIIARHVLEHSPMPMLVLLQISDILKVGGGFCYVEVPAPDTEMYHEFNHNHYSVFGKRGWEALFLKCNFTIRECFTIRFSVAQLDGSKLNDTYLSWILEVPKS